MEWRTSDFNWKLSLNFAAHSPTEASLLSFFTATPQLVLQCARFSRLIWSNHRDFLRLVNANFLDVDDVDRCWMIDENTSQPRVENPRRIKKLFNFLKPKCVISLGRDRPEIYIEEKFPRFWTCKFVDLHSTHIAECNVSISTALGQRKTSSTKRSVYVKNLFVYFSSHFRSSMCGWNVSHEK